MSEYVPELLNELTRIVLTTRNDNPSPDEYDSLVLPEWRRVQDMALAREQRGGAASLEEMRAVLHGVLFMLSVKHVSRTEIDERVREAFERSNRGAYPVDSQRVEEGAWAAVNTRLGQLRQGNSAA
jgi:hypothetical protein